MSTMYKIYKIDKRSFLFFPSFAGLLGAVQGPGAFIHCWIVHHIVNARKQTKI
jgi:hypothetical protein